MKYLGAHVSIAGGVRNAPLHAAQIGATALAMFTKNQQQWSAPPISLTESAAFTANLDRCGIEPRHILAHDSYLINLGNPNDVKRERAYQALVDELHRCEQLGILMLNIHPGSHVREISEEGCLRLIAECINRALAETANVTVVLENTAGQGSNVGYRFEHLAMLTELVTARERIGVCLDTCHSFAAGYDLRTPAAVDGVLREFDAVVGLHYLRGMHINDSKHELGSRKDRHACLGKGFIGLNGFAALMRDPRLDHLVMTLETPDVDGYAREIALLRSFEQEGGS